MFNDLPIWFLKGNKGYSHSVFLFFSVRCLKWRPVCIYVASPVYFQFHCEVDEMGFSKICKLNLFWKAMNMKIKTFSALSAWGQALFPCTFDSRLGLSGFVQPVCVCVRVHFYFQKTDFFNLLVRVETHLSTFGFMGLKTFKAFSLSLNRLLRTKVMEFIFNILILSPSLTYSLSLSFFLRVCMFDN